MDADRPGPKHISFRLDPDTHRRLRLVLAREQKSFQALFADYVRRYLEAKEK